MSPVGVHNVIELSVHLATTMLGVTVGFLRRSLDWGSDQAALLEALGKSFLFSTLLPTTLAQLGPLASRQPKVLVVAMCRDVCVCHVSMCVWVFTHVYMCVCGCLHVSACICVGVYTCPCVCMCVCRQVIVVHTFGVV